MKIAIALLAALLVSACAKPAPKIPPQPQTMGRPGILWAGSCFARAGSYMMIANLETHNCGKVPKQTLVSLVVVGEKAFPCGKRTVNSTTDAGEVETTIAANSQGMAGRMVIRSKGCSARYELLFLRLR